MTDTPALTLTADEEPDGGPIEAFALALDVDSWEEAVDLAQRSVPNLSNIGWVLAPRKVIHDLLIPAYEGFGKAVSDPSLVGFVRDWLYAWKAGCELLGLPTDLDTMDSQPTRAALAAPAASPEAPRVVPDAQVALDAIERERGLREALLDIATMLPGSVPLPMTEEQYLRQMLYECVCKARAALAPTVAASEACQPSAAETGCDGLREALRRLIDAIETTGLHEHDDGRGGVDLCIPISGIRGVMNDACEAAGHEFLHPEDVPPFCRWCGAALAPTVAACAREGCGHEEQHHRVDPDDIPWCWKDCPCPGYQPATASAAATSEEE